MDTLQMSLGVIITLVVVALLFDFMNGFHDAANSIATIVSTRVLKPHHAVIWAAASGVGAVSASCASACISMRWSMPSLVLQRGKRWRSAAMKPSRPCTSTLRRCA